MRRVKLLQRHRHQEDTGYHAERPLPDAAPEPQPERNEPRLDEPTPTTLSKRDYFPILWRAAKEFNRDHMTSIAAALAYYAFLAIPSALLVVLGAVLAFGVLVLGPQLSTWIGNALGAQSVVKIVWYVAEWPLLLGGLLVAFAGLTYYAPNVKHPRWRLLSFGAVTAIVIWLAA